MHAGKSLLAAFLLAAAFTSAGCSSWPKDINARLDTASRETPPSVDVHVIPAQASEVKRLKTMSVTEYFSAAGQSRLPMPGRKELFLSPDQPSKTIRSNDPIWKTWD